MFTGIIEDLGAINAIAPLQAGSRLLIATAIATSEISMGESICVNGACMTVVEISETTFAVDVSAESLRCTTLGGLEVGDAVNLERSIRLQDRLGGHLVSGHVDGTGCVEAIRPEGESSIYRFSVPVSLSPLLVEKGSVAVDGISLTCFNCEHDGFDVAVVFGKRILHTANLRGNLAAYVHADVLRNLFNFAFDFAHKRFGQ